MQTFTQEHYCFGSAATTPPEHVTRTFHLLKALLTMLSSSSICAKLKHSPASKI